MPGGTQGSAGDDTPHSRVATAADARGSADAQAGALADTDAASGSGEAGSPATAGAAAQVQLPGVAAAASASASSASVAGVPMQQMIDAIRATIEIAARQGATQARIALQPEDLGHISIRLSQTSDGLIARVSAETATAAQALVNGRSELHQSLSSLGVSLLRLDIGTFGQSHAGERDGRFAGNPDSPAGAGASNEPTEVDGAETPAELQGAGTPSARAAGELVDVLA